MSYIGERAMQVYHGDKFAYFLVIEDQFPK